MILHGSKAVAHDPSNGRPFKVVFYYVSRGHKDTGLPPLPMALVWNGSKWERYVFKAGGEAI